MSIGGRLGSAGDSLLQVKDTQFTKRGNVKITFEDGTKAKISQEAYLSSYIYPGKKFTKTEWNKILAIDGESSARSYVEDLMNRRMYAPKEVLDKLMKIKKLDYKTAAILVDKLEKEGIIDEKGYATELVDELKNKGYSPEGIRRKLEAKGISNETVESLAAKIDAGDYSSAIQSLAKVIRLHPDDSYKVLEQKIYKQLFIMGYGSNQIDAVLEETKLLFPELTSRDREQKALLDLADKAYVRIDVMHIDSSAKTDKLYRFLLSKGFSSDDINELIRKDEFKFK